MSLLGTTSLLEAFTSTQKTKDDVKMHEQICALEKQVCDLKMWNFYMIIMVLAVLLIISLLFNIINFAQRK